MGGQNVLLFSSSCSGLYLRKNIIFGVSSGDRFGDAISMNAGGTRFVSGAHEGIGLKTSDGSSSLINTDEGQGHAIVYEKINNSWVQMPVHALVEGDQRVVSLNYNNTFEGQEIIETIDSTNAEKILGLTDFSGNKLLYNPYVSGGDQEFGNNVVMSGDGNWIAVSNSFNRPYHMADSSTDFMEESGEIITYKYQNINGTNKWVCRGRILNIETLPDDKCIELNLFSTGETRFYQSNNLWNVRTQEGTSRGSEVAEGNSNHRDGLDMNYDGSRIIFSQFQSDYVIPNNDDLLTQTGAATATFSRENRGYIQVYEWNESSNNSVSGFSGNWEKLGQTLHGYNELNDEFGYSVCMNSSGNRIAVAARYENINDLNNNGTVRIYEYNDNTNLWEQLGNTISGTQDSDRLASSLCFDSTGNILAIGACQANGNDGFVIVYKFENNSWITRGSKLDSSFIFPNETQTNMDIGYRVKLSSNGNKLVISCPRYEINNTGSNIGKIIIFNFISGDWVQDQSNISGGANYTSELGEGLAISQDANVILAGAPDSSTSDSNAENDLGQVTSGNNWGYISIYEL